MIFLEMGISKKLMPVVRQRIWHKAISYVLEDLKQMQSSMGMNVIMCTA